MRIRANQSGSRFAALRQTIARSVLTALSLTFTDVSTGVARANQPAARAGDQARLLQSISEAQRLPMAVDNSEQAPLLIQSATTREIEGAAFQQLTGGKAEAAKYVLLPDVALTNTADRAVVSLSVCLDSKLADEKHCLRFQRVNMTPGGQFSIVAKDWAGPRGMMMPNKFVQQDGKFVKESRTLDLHSAAMWLPGGIADYRVIVLSAVFEDGTKWVTKR